MWTMDADGRRLRPLLGSSAVGDHFDPEWSPDGSMIAAFSPQWSPDGSSLLYATFRSSLSPFGTQLWTSRVHGWNPQLVRSRRNFSFDLSATWSPGGGELLVSEQDDSRRGFWAHLILMNVNGDHVRTLLHRNNELFVDPD
jgi:Tol biopolymer transport system component